MDELLLSSGGVSDLCDPWGGEGCWAWWDEGDTTPPVTRDRPTVGEVGGDDITLSGTTSCLGDCTWGGGLGTAEILARSDWNDVDGEYIPAIADGDIIWCGDLKEIYILFRNSKINVFLRIKNL